MVTELLTTEAFYDVIIKGEGVIVIADITGTRTAHPVTCPSLDAQHFVEKVITNRRRNGRYYRVSSFPEARRELDADRCQCR